MNNENQTFENTAIHGHMIEQTTNNIKTSSKIIRLITLCLQIASMFAYYVPSIINRGEVGVIWLAIGVLQTVVFSIVFFRDERKRLVTSIILMVIGTMFNLALLILIGFYTLLDGSQMGISYSTAYVYVLCSLVALVFALCFPRRYEKIQPVHVPDHQI